MYIEQICLCALFFLARDEQKRPSAIPEAVLTLILIALTVCSIRKRYLLRLSVWSQVFFHYTIIDSYGPLIKGLPLTLADKTYGIKKDDIAEGGEPAPTTEAKLKEGEAAIPDPGSGEASGVERYELQPRRTRSDQRIEEDEDGIKHKPGAHEGDIGEEGTAPSVLEEPAEDAREDDGPTDFTHPAVAGHRHAVWLPVDPLNLVQDEVAAIRVMGIDVTTDGAVMNERGHVDISAAPPDLRD
jgi:calcium permeable stress-gated cation channel